VGTSPPRTSPLAGLVCGNPCYESFGIPLGGGFKNADDFLAKYQKALQNFGNKAGIPSDRLAIFQSVSDNVGDFGGTKKIGGAPEITVDDEVMDR